MGVALAAKAMMQYTMDYSTQLYADELRGNSHKPFKSQHDMAEWDTIPCVVFIVQTSP